LFGNTSEASMQCPRCGLTNPDGAIQCDCHYDFQAGALAVGTPRALGLPLATFGERFAGHFLDSALTCGGMVLGSYIGASLGVGPAPAMVMFIGYLLFSDGLGEGQSFGKKLVKIAVVDKTTGRPCGYGRSVVRNVVRMFGLFDWIFMLGERRQRLGDKAANTIVVRLPR
jgi:uncharacterized RDD family membrane protein YckC